MMKEVGEESLGNHDSDLAQPELHSTNSSPESHWEEDQEVIPTFFSTMNTRYSWYSLLFHITDIWIPVFLQNRDCGVPCVCFIVHLV